MIKATMTEAELLAQAEAAEKIAKNWSWIDSEYNQREGLCRLAQMVADLSRDQAERVRDIGQ